MADAPSKTPVPLDNAAVKQHHRMAAGQPVTGQTLPKAPGGNKAPA